MNAVLSIDLPTPRLRLNPKPVQKFWFDPPAPTGTRVQVLGR